MLKKGKRHKTEKETETWDSKVFITIPAENQGTGLDL